MATASALNAQPDPRQNPMIGRWDVTIRNGRQTHPSWFEVKLSGHKTLVGEFVHRGGSARPVSEYIVQGDRIEFEVPQQWEKGPERIRFEGRLSGNGLEGRMRTDEGEWLQWTAERAPHLRRKNPPLWGETKNLFNGKDLSGWQPRVRNRPNGWVVENGVLRNKKPGNDLVSIRKFHDFKLHAEFRYPAGSNSGVYLRGRYEAQVEDNYGRHPGSHLIGGIYGFLTPRVNAAKPAGEWQSYDITLVGRRVTVVLNGELVIDRQEIPGITGGALDSREGEPGPIMLQGDHGPIEFRRITITPADFPAAR